MHHFGHLVGDFHVPLHEKLAVKWKTRKTGSGHGTGMHTLVVIHHSVCGTIQFIDPLSKGGGIDGEEPVGVYEFIQVKKEVRMIHDRTAAITD